MKSIREMTPAEVYEYLIGSQSVEDFVFGVEEARSEREAVLEYVLLAPNCQDLTVEDKMMAVVKLVTYIQDTLEDEGIELMWK